MTSLRYAVPFIKTAKKLLDIDVSLVYELNANTHKYNSISKNKKRFDEIVERNKLTSVSVDHTELQTRILFSVECQSSKKIKYEKLCSFQHAFDYHFERSHQDRTCLVTDDYFKTYYESKNEKTVAVQPFPVVFWDWDFNVLAAKHFSPTNGLTATIFYPERDHSHRFFHEVYRVLKDKNFDVKIKQRRKHTSIPSNFENQFYDDVWYPSESVFLPMTSDIIVGFETSAYTDLYHLKKSYYDFATEPHAKSFYKPNASNFHMMPENFEEAMSKFKEEKFELHTDKHTFPFNLEEIKRFLESLFR